MIIALGSDHAGFELKQQIKNFLEIGGFQIMDFGAENNSESVQYPDFAKAVAKAIVKGEAGRGILVCGSGIGMSISANRFGGIRCALCHDVLAARLSRQHNDSNILALGAWFTPIQHAQEIIKTWMSTEFEGGRHQIRIEKIEELKKKNV